MRINHRRILNGLFESQGIKDKSVEVLRIVDKLEKIGSNKVKEELISLGVLPKSAEILLDVLSWEGAPIEILRRLRAAEFVNDEISAGAQDLELIINYLKSAGLKDSCYKIDLSIARGLDYYTGMVVETNLNDYPQLGSICSGGRYENLAECYTDKKLLGVGAAIGVSRLFSQLRELGLMDTGELTPAKVLIVSGSDLDFASATASRLRAAGVSVQVMVDPKLKKGLSFANKTKIPYVLIAGEDEIKDRTYNLKEMISGEQHRVSDFEDILRIIKL